MHLRDEHYRKISFLKVEKRVTFLKLVMVFKILKKMVPKYLLEYYVFVSEVHCHSTRASSNDIYTCRFKSEMGKKYFLYSSSVAWNKLPGCIQEIQVDCIFRREVKNGCFIIDVLKFVW